MNKKKWFTTLKILAAYLVAAWTFLQFVDWALSRYNISPYWVDVLLWFFIGIIPSLIIYLYHKERIDQRVFKLREKIFFPLNLLILAVALYIGFGNSDLGATTKEINYTDNQGEAQSATITKEEFRIGVPIYEFENLNSSDSTDWWQQGIGLMLYFDLDQNKSLNPIFDKLTKTADKIRNASLFHDFYVDGNYSKEGDSIAIEVFIRKASNAKILSSRKFRGNDVLNLLDDASIYISEQAGFVETNRLQYLDLPLSSFMSESDEAIKEFIEGDYYQAIDYDSTFAMAFLENSKINRIYSRSNIESRDLTDKAYQYREKLPLQKQLEVIIERSLAYKDFESAEAQVKLQLEVDPNNYSYNDILYTIYSNKRELGDILDHANGRFASDPGLVNGSRLMTALLVNGQDEELLNLLETYEFINPMLRIYKLNPLILQGKISEADALLKDIQTTYPQFENTYFPFEIAVDYLKSEAPNTDYLSQFEGTYRSNNKEQRVTFWMHEDRMIHQIENQPAMSLLVAGDNVLVSGFPSLTSFREEFMIDENNNVVGIFLTQYKNEGTLHLWFWKEDESIRKAHEAFHNGPINQAKALYETAYKNNPRHVYLKNIIDHITYINEVDTETLIAQYEKHQGNYGPRKFYIENGKFLYKYKDVDAELFKVQLLPIDENRYMDLTRLGRIMIFEENNAGALLSKNLKFEVGEDRKFEWLLAEDDNGVRSFIKDN